MRLVIEADGSVLALVDALEPEYQDARHETVFLAALRLLRDAAADPRDFREMREFVVQAKGARTTPAPAKPQVIDQLAWMLVRGELRIEPVVVESISLPPPGPPPVAPPVPVAKKKEESELTWIAVELLDEDGNPLVGEPYEIVLTDGRTESGEFKDSGEVNVPAIPKGTCKVKFPRLDREASAS